MKNQILCCSRAGKKKNPSRNKGSGQLEGQWDGQQMNYEEKERWPWPRVWAYSAGQRPQQPGFQTHALRLNFPIAQGPALPELCLCPQSPDCCCWASEGLWGRGPAQRTGKERRGKHAPGLSGNPGRNFPENMWVCWLTSFWSALHSVVNIRSVVPTFWSKRALFNNVLGASQAVSTLEMTYNRKKRLW